MTISLNLKLFILVRNLIFPFRKIEGYFPKKGKILDIGCGYGYFPALLAQKSPLRTVLGIDPSGVRIRQAKILFKKISNLKFKVSDVAGVKKLKFDAISIIDILYLLPTEQQIFLLKKAAQLLKTNGLLILKETEKNWWIALEECLMVKFFKFTYSKHDKIFLENKSGYETIIKKAGLKIVGFKSIRRFFVYKHLIFILTQK